MFVFFFFYSILLGSFLSTLMYPTAYKKMPSLDYDIFTHSGERGWIGSWHSHLDDDSLIPLDEVLETQLIDETQMFIGTSVPQGITKRWTMKLRGYLKPRPYDCIFEFGLAASGRAKVHTHTFIA